MHSRFALRGWKYSETMKCFSLKKLARSSAGIFLFSLACLGLAAGEDTPRLRTEVVHIDSPVPGLALALLHEFPVQAKKDNECSRFLRAVPAPPSQKVKPSGGKRRSILRPPIARQEYESDIPVLADA
jgi:hypothetical protein